MCRAFQPSKMQGIYFSLKTIFQIKISPFHLRLLQSHHILLEQKPRFAKKNYLLFYYIIDKPQNVFVFVIVFVRSDCFLGPKVRCFCRDNSINLM